MLVLDVPNSTWCFIKSIKDIMTNLIQIGSTLSEWKVGKLLKAVIKGKGKVHPCTGTVALYRPYGP